MRIKNDLNAALKEFQQHFKSMKATRRSDGRCRHL